MTSSGGEAVHAAAERGARRAASGGEYHYDGEADADTQAARHAGHQHHEGEEEACTQSKGCAHHTAGNVGNNGKHDAKCKQNASRSGQLFAGTRF